MAEEVSHFVWETKAFVPVLRVQQEEQELLDAVGTKAVDEEPANQEGLKLQNCKLVVLHQMLIAAETPCPLIQEASHQQR